MRSSAGSISLAQRMVDETRAKRDQGDGTKFDPYATLSQSHLSFGCLFQDPEDRSSFKIVITLSQENTLLICKNGTVHESLPARAIKDIVASSRPDVQIITTDGSASCVCYSFNLKVDPIYTVDGSSGRHFLMGSLYDVQMLTKYLTMLMAGKKLSLIPVPQYDKAGFVQFGRDGLWSNKWCVLAGERMLFYNEKRSEIPFQCFTLPSIHSFEMSGFNTSHEPLPQPAHLMHLPPEYPYTATLNVGVDIEILQWNYEEDAQDWHEDVMERRAQVINEYEQELESAKKAKQDLELAALEQEKRLEEQKKKAQRQRIKPLQIFPFVTHTRPQCAYIAYRMPTPVQGVTGGSLLFNDSSEALMAQSLNLTNLPALNNKLIVEVAMGGGSESTYVNHQENIQSDYFLLQDVPEPGVPPTAPTGHCCVITAQGQAYIWGEGGPGVLGLGPDKVQQRVPILMTPLIKNVIVQVSCGYNHTIMLTNKGEVLTFGLNHYGQLGLNQQDADSGYPRRVEEIEDPVRYIYAAGNSSFALTTNGHCYVWGSNANNILGLLGPEFVPLPTIQPDLSGCLQQISISPDATHGLALLYHPNGAPDAATQYAATVLAWGANSRGQLGMGSGAKDEILFTTPSAVPKLTNIALHVNEEVMDVASVMDNANIIGICATNGASAVWHSNMEVMIWGRAGVTGFGSDSSSPHKLRANNIAVINMVAASCGFIFMDNNNALFQSNDTQGIYALAVQSKTSNASQPLYCSIVAPFLGPLRTLPKADGDAVGVGCCAFALTLSGSTPSQSSIPQGQAPQAMGMTNFASTSRSPQQAAPGAAGIQYQPPKAAAGGYNPPTSGGSNLYVAGRKLGGPAMPKRAPPPPPGLDEAPTSRAGQAQVQVGAMLHHANQSGLMNNAQNQEAIQKDVLMAASLILGLHQEASTRAQQAAAPPKPQGMDFMQMVNNMPTTPQQQQQQQQPQQQQQFAYQQQPQQPQQFAYQQQQQQPQQQFAYQQQQQQQQPQQQQFAYQQQQQPQAPQPQYAQYQQAPPSQPPSQPPQQPIGGFPPPPPEDDDDMPPPPPGAFAAPRQQQQYQAPPPQQQQYQAPSPQQQQYQAPPQQQYQAPPQQQYQAPQQQYQAPPPQQLPPQPQEQQQHNQQQQFGQANIQTQQQLGGGFAQPNAQVANMVTSSGVLSVPSQPQAPQSRTFNNKFLAPKQQQMKQELNNVVPPPPPPDDDEDF